MPAARSYSVATRAWYSTWAASGQAAYFTATEWQRLGMLAIVVEKFYESGDVKLLTEVRQNESLLGATAVDRARLGWRLDSGSEPALAATEKVDPVRAARDAAVLKLVSRDKS